MRTRVPLPSFWLAPAPEYPGRPVQGVQRFRGGMDPLHRHAPRTLTLLYVC